ncbi:hypothetical protein AVEN_268396-1 [Araneus ventricosus]|uniref:MBD domain-containing protein n=1 Tax=Araneus ventricosus TaxID=182803 RepID=A0A4Y2DUS6_ARAVE|nr:hypothetical protein AVEN_268396-1 [Araneus ventricosus]
MAWNSVPRYLKKAGIMQQRTNIYSPEMNGVAECLNRTMAGGVRCLRVEAELPKAGLAYTFIYLKNRFPHKSIKGKIPYTLMYGRKCSVRHLKVIGSLAYVYVKKHKRDELDSKAKEGRRDFVRLSAAHDEIEDEETTTKNSSTSEKPQLQDIEWDRKVVEKKSGKTKGNFDIYYYPEGKAGPRLRSHNDVKKYCEDNNIKYDAQQFNFYHQVGESIPQSHADDDDDSSGLENYHTTVVEPTSYEEAMIQPGSRS